MSALKCALCCIDISLFHKKKEARVIDVLCAYDCLAKRCCLYLNCDFLKAAKRPQWIFQRVKMLQVFDIWFVLCLIRTKATIYKYVYETSTNIVVTIIQTNHNTIAQLCAYISGSIWLKMHNCQKIIQWIHLYLN